MPFRPEYAIRPGDQIEVKVVQGDVAAPSCGSASMLSREQAGTVLRP